MKKFIYEGKEYNIPAERAKSCKDVQKNECFGVRDANCIFSAQNDEALKAYLKVGRRFTKKDLQSGMLVVLRDGRRRVVILSTKHGDITFNRKSSQGGNLHDYNDDLTAPTGFCEIDVMEVHQPLSWKMTGSLKLTSYSLVWQRDDNAPKEDTGKQSKGGGWEEAVIRYVRV